MVFQPVEYKLRNGALVTIRSLRLTDAAAFLKFRQQIAAETSFTMNYPGMSLPTEAAAGAELESRILERTTLSLGAFDGGKVAGHLYFRVAHPEHPWQKHVAQFSMMSLKAYWGQGLAGRLVDLQEAHAMAHAITRIEGMVRANNPRAIRFYTRLGYLSEGTRRNANRMDHQFVDELYVARLL